MEPEARLYISHSKRPNTALQLLIGTETYSRLKKTMIKENRKIGATFFKPPEDIYMNFQVRENHVMNKKYEGEEGVHRTDEFTKLELRDQMDKIFITHMSHNRNFDGYSNFISASFSHLSSIYTHLSEIFINGLLQVSRDIPLKKGLRKFKVITKMMKNKV